MPEAPVPTMLNLLDAETSRSGWLQLDKVFWLTVALLIVVAIAGAVIRRRQRDRALRLLDGARVSLILPSGQTVTGRLLIEGQGAEIVFDTPQASPAGPPRHSMLVYEPELAAATAIMRWPKDLTASERTRREASLRTRLHPGPFRSFGRAARNLFNTARDAIAQSFSLLVGRLRPGGTLGTALRGQELGLVGLGNTVIGLGANAYEPLLEHRSGEPVIVEIARAAKASEAPPPHEFAGYLMDYSDRYLCIMGNGWETARSGRLVSPSRTAGPVAGEGLRIERNGDKAKIFATGPDAVVLRDLREPGAIDRPLAILLADAWIEIDDPDDGPLEVTYELTRALDLVAPRSRARVRFGAAPPKS